MVKFRPLWHAGHVMEAGDAGVVRWTEQPSISDSSSMIYCLLSPLMCSLFLSLIIFLKTVGLQCHTAPLHCLHLILCVLHPGIWPKALPFVVVVFLFIAELFPPHSQYVTSLPKSDLSQRKMCSSHCKIPLCRETHLRPQKSTSKTLFFLSALQ